MKNKKGQLEIGGSTVMIYMLIIFVIVIIVFFVLFAIKNEGLTGETIGSTDFGAVQLNNDLLNFLKTPIEYEGEKMMVADLLARIDMKEGEDARREFFTEMFEDFVNGRYPELENYWVLAIFDESENQDDLSFIPYKYFDYLLEGYFFSSSCQSENYHKAIFYVPKINGQTIRLIFCLNKRDLVKIK